MQRGRGGSEPFWHKTVQTSTFYIKLLSHLDNQSNIRFSWDRWYGFHRWDINLHITQHGWSGLNDPKTLWLYVGYLYHIKRCKGCFHNLVWWGLIKCELCFKALSQLSHWLDSQTFCVNNCWSRWQANLLQKPRHASKMIYLWPTLAQPWVKNLTQYLSNIKQSLPI